MIDRRARWITALIVIALLMVVVILFATIDLDLDQHTRTNVGSAPILAGQEADATQHGPPARQQDSTQREETPTPGD